MKALPDILKKESYQKIKFKISKTQHLLLRVTINGVNGNFILDTGASNSCVGFESIEFFQLHTKKSKIKIAGAGATGMATQIAKNNTIKIGRWLKNDFAFVVFDLSHVNQALLHHKSKPVHGIIGADILLKGKGIIDYYNQYLYLQK